MITSTEPLSAGNGSDGNGTGGGSVNSNVLTPEGEIKRRAITSEAQLKNIISTLEQQNRERSIKNARIMSRYNAEQPFSQSELVNSGLGWKANFSTRPLAAIIDRLAPRYVRAAMAPRFVTSAQLPATHKDWRTKTDTFRRELTTLLRSHPKWKGLLTEIAQENALFGYAVPAILDEISWLPRFYKQDEVFIPTGTGQLASEAQVIIFNESCLISELYGRVEDSEAAEGAGWDVAKTVEVINGAKPKNVNDDFQTAFRAYEDVRRDTENALGLTGGPVSVRLYHCLAQEITGKVSHYIVAGDSKTLIFKRTDRYESMNDVATFFTFQQGNGRLAGSLGVGRLAYNIATAVDRARCEVVDRFQISGKLLFSTKSKDLTRFKMTVLGQAAIIGEGFDIIQQKLESGVDEFVALDQFLNGILNETAGNVSPSSPNLQGDRVTAAAVNVVATREEEMRDIRLERFLDGYLTMIAGIQRRLKDPDVAKVCDRAARFRKACLKVMPVDEFELLCESSPAQTIDDLTDAERQRKVLAYNELAQVPGANTYKVLLAKYTILLGEDEAKELLPDPNDSTAAQAQTRQQLVEIPSISEGIPVPALVTDRHDLHIAACLQIAKTEPDTQKAQFILQHAMAHAQLSKDENLIKTVREAVNALAKAVTASQPPQMTPTGGVAPPATVNDYSTVPATPGAAAPASPVGDLSGAPA